MKRPASVKALIVAQFVLATAGMAIAIYLAVLTRSPEILRDKDAAGVVRGLWISAATTSIPALLAGVIAIHLVRRKRWAWWTGMVLNLVLGVILAYSAFDENNIDSDDIVTALLPIGMLALYFLAGVRRWFAREAPAQSVQAA